jgi:tetratricopeptide (TPR) repeat protein
MSNSEKHAFEKESLKDPFLSDALDGYSDNPDAISALKRMDQKRFGRSKTWTKVSFGLFLVVAFLYYFSPATKSPSPKKKVVSVKTHVIKLSNETLKSLEKINPKDEIVAKRLQSDFKVKDKQSHFQIQENPVFPSEELVQLPIQPKGKVDRIQMQRRSNFAMETYIQDLKVLDYRYYRTKVKSDRSTLLTGTPAALETSQSEMSTKELLEISYINYLSSTLSDFNQGEYKVALRGFDEILKSYPDDVNALFYSALCLYNLQQFTLCEQRLSLIDLVRFDNFDEEQKWYLLLCYRSQGKIEAFTSLRKEIIQENGFYATKANMLSFR